VSTTELRQAQPAPTPLPRWVTRIGWACVAGCCVFSAAVAGEILEVGDREVMGGITDFFLPSPQALSMLLWELSLIWIVVVAIQLIRLKRRSAILRSRDVTLALSLALGFAVCRVLIGILGAKGVRIGIPGVDH
jgi:hypothetical protein